MTATLQHVTPQLFNYSGSIELESGGVLDGYELVFETYGTLNAEKSNAILVCHALTGDHHAAGIATDESQRIGWWDALIGPGKAIDTERFFIVSPNNLGGCFGSTGPSSINPDTQNVYGPDFPMVTVTDFVRTQKHLAEHLGIDCWAAVIGGSLGGMQALQWSIQYPSHLKNAIVIAAAATLSAQNIAFNEVARQAIRSDPDYCDGYYQLSNKTPHRGLRVARMMSHITYLSDLKMANKFGRALRDKAQFDYQYETEFEVESYLRYQGDQFVKRFDPNTYLLMTKALDYFDLAGDGDIANGLTAATADFLVVSFSSDWRFSVERSKEIVNGLLKNNLNVSYAEIESDHGHDSFLLDIPYYTQAVSAYLSRIKVADGGD